MSAETKKAFFDGIAEKWDSWEDLTAVAEKLSRGLLSLGMRADEMVVDVGCGTGNLTRAIVEKLSPAGRVVAIDLSTEMVARAREKVSDPRVAWHVADVSQIPVDDETVDRIICLSVWPHVEDPGAAIEEFGRVLRGGGAVHLWHLASRATINEIHASAGEAVAQDVLVPAHEAAALLEAHGFAPYEVIDDDERYLVSARKPATSR